MSYIPPFLDQIALAEARILDTYGDTVSVANKKKSLRKFGETTQCQTASTTLMGNLAGVYNETYVERNLITHIASSSASDTMIVSIEGHTAGADVSVSGITQTTGTATATTGSAHGFAVNEWVNIEGAGEAGYNGIVKVLSTPLTTTFTYTVATGTATPATGTITTNTYNKTFVVQTKTLQGQTKVALDTPISRASRVYVSSQNKASNAVGDIYVAEDVTFTAGVPASAVHCMIVAGGQQSKKGATTLSSSDYWLVLDFHAHNSEKTTGRLADVNLQIREPGGVFRTVEDLSVSAGNTVGIAFLETLIVIPNSEIRLVAQSSANGHTIGGTIQGYLAN